MAKTNEQQLNRSALKKRNKYRKKLIVLQSKLIETQYSIIKKLQGDCSFYNALLKRQFDDIHMRDSMIINFKDMDDKSLQCWTCEKYWISSVARNL